ncbi:hypothetical protein [Falsiroseomonas tokyonensis]|uniref:Uncharacterized protein n=1 Tax=Falsiroseomonas tokyonensis TaxID=430521 RepID=A0ABV7C4N7_9PROT|nr:hypothetical protein [Falsiroseomonas tokyonensis]MBU8541909.1 hypothetical protein [Falsiroseomonas tokyonensis]
MDSEHRSAERDAVSGKEREAVTLDEGGEHRTTTSAVANVAANPTALNVLPLTLRAARFL